MFKLTEIVRGWKISLLATNLEATVGLWLCGGGLCKYSGYLYDWEFVVNMKYSKWIKKSLRKSYIDINGTFLHILYTKFRVCLASRFRCPCRYINRYTFGTILLVYPAEQQSRPNGNKEELKRTENRKKGSEMKIIRIFYQLKFLWIIHYFPAT